MELRCTAQARGCKNYTLDAENAQNMQYSHFKEESVPGPVRILPDSHNTGLSEI
jgi:hypothetical protein